VAGRGVLLRDCAGRRDAVREAIRAAVERNCPPFHLYPDDLDGIPALRLRSDQEWAMVVAREIGPDLHVGWTMWRSRSTFGLLGAILGDLVDGSRANDAQLLQAGSSSALRALLDTAVSRTATLRE
jgi:hypothetical protein